MLLLSVLQYMTAKDGSVMGVTNTHSSMLCLCRTLTVACNYTEGEFMQLLKGNGQRLLFVNLSGATLGFVQLNHLNYLKFSMLKVHLN